MVIDSFFDKIKEYQPIGPKPQEFKKYQTINWIQSNMDGISQEDVDQYNLSLGKLFRWL